MHVPIWICETVNQNKNVNLNASSSCFVNKIANRLYIPPKGGAIFTPKAVVTGVLFGDLELLDCLHSDLIDIMAE
jgi:hypothetical protein